jgi:hypothetical protein
VNAALKSAQRCLLLKLAGKLPAEACQLTGRSTGRRRTDAALAHAEARLGRGLRPCSAEAIENMGFDFTCDDPTPDDDFTRADLERCVAETHVAAVQALLGVQFPQDADSCGDGVVDEDEECDPAASPSECFEDEVCGGAGSADACLCITQDEPSCGNGIVDDGEDCDPAAAPSGCAAGMCGAVGTLDECTCLDDAEGDCQGACTPACAAGQTCVCECAVGVEAAASLRGRSRR